MASEAAFARARELLNFANGARDDPRRTRIDLLQVGNYIASKSEHSPELRDILQKTHKLFQMQKILPDDLNIASKNGWPIIKAMPGPVSYFYCAIRLIAHTALESKKFIQTFEKRMEDLGEFEKGLSSLLEPDDLFSALTLVTAEMADDSEFRSRLIAAAKDTQQIMVGDEFPNFRDFVRKPLVERRSWPPLRLGVLPISGGMWRENPDDWDDSEGGGSSTVSAAVFCELDSSSPAGEWIACGIAVVAVIVIYIVLS